MAAHEGRALVTIGLFHFANARLFQIGVFPVLAMAATLVLLPPDWPRQLARRLGRQRSADASGVGSEVAPAPETAATTRHCCQW